MSTRDPLERHRPERRHSRKDGLVLYSCCCCCCCCLHTIGSVIGAAVGGNYRHEPAVSETPPRVFPSTQGMFWLSFLIAGFIGIVVLALAFMRGTGLLYIPTDYGTLEKLFYATGYSAEVIGLSMILIGPAWLLGACAVMAVWIGFWPELRSDRGYWKSLGKITFGVVAGCIIGILVMVGIYIALTSR